MKRFYPAIALFITAILAYGLLLPSLGFYWDDLPMSWIRYELGPEAMARYFSTNRPVWGLLYLLDGYILPHVPIYWQVFGLLLRALTGILAWAVIKRIWLGRDTLALTAAFVFLLYPGFNQQWGSYLYSHFFIVINFYLASLYFTLRALDEPRHFRLHTGLALVFSALNLWMMEYFFFLELIRPFIIFFALQSRDAQTFTPFKQIAARSLRLSVPYVLIWIADLIFRFTVFNNTVYTTSLIGEIKDDFLGGLGHLIQMILASFWTVSGAALSQVFQLPNPSADGPRVTLMVAAVALVVFGVTQYVFYGIYPGKQVDRSTGTRGNREQDSALNVQRPTVSFVSRLLSFPLYVLILALLALFFAGWPLWLINFPPTLAHPTSRFTLPFMFGVSLLVAGLLEFIPWVRWKYLLAGMLIALCAGRQAFWMNDYRLEWDRQTALFWQMTWRAPGLIPNTMVLLNDRAIQVATSDDKLTSVDARVLNFYADNSLAAALNWIYDPAKHSDQIPYVLFYPKSRIGGALPSFEKDQPVTYDFLAGVFHGNTSQTVAFYYAPPGCLRVLDADIDVVNRYFPDETLMREAAALSSSRWIMTEEIARMPDVYGSEPTHGWCYYFERADLARQQGDWKEVVRLGEIAFGLGDHPNDPVERFVFIEGYAHVGQWARAQELSVEAFRVSREFVGPMLCRLWARIASQTTPNSDQQNAVDAMQTKFGCASP